jgi:hypothetical protein
VAHTQCLHTCTHMRARKRETHKRSKLTQRHHQCMMVEHYWGLGDPFPDSGNSKDGLHMSSTKVDHSNLTTRRAAHVQHQGQLFKLDHQTQPHIINELPPTNMYRHAGSALATASGVVCCGIGRGRLRGACTTTAR